MPCEFDREESLTKMRAAFDHLTMSSVVSPHVVLQE